MEIRHSCLGIEDEASVTAITRVERIWLKSDKHISQLAHLAKNLYNEANYIIRQEFFKTGRWIRYYELNRQLKDSENYRALPAQTAQQVLRIVDRNWKSFFRAMKEWKKHPEKFKERPRIPHYKKKDSEFVLVFTNQQVKLRDGWLIILPKNVGLKVKTRIREGLREVRIIPKGMGYVLEIVYKKKLEVGRRNKDRIVGIDIGVRNLITMANNIGEQPIVVKGGVIKNINQFYNKEKARLQSVYDSQGIKTGKKMKKLSAKRERKLNDFLHKISKFVVDWCVEHDIGTIVIGYNPDWKQEVELGKRNNQTFVQIPFTKLIHQIAYKAEERGIEVKIQDEAHSSKCSFLDGETVKHHEEYAGIRKSRGLFRSARGTIINADVNAAYNIIRKAVPKAFAKVEADGIEGVGLHPVRCSIK
ncbi:MAG: transposase [Methanophagales archaeon]|nr:transposase [Methanophagales archaeon]